MKSFLACRFLHATFISASFFFSTVDSHASTSTPEQLAGQYSFEITTADVLNMPGAAARVQAELKNLQMLANDGNQYAQHGLGLLGIA